MAMAHTSWLKKIIIIKLKTERGVPTPDRLGGGHVVATGRGLGPEDQTSIMHVGPWRMRRALIPAAESIQRNQVDGTSTLTEGSLSWGFARQWHGDDVVSSNESVSLSRLFFFSFFIGTTLYIRLCGPPFKAKRVFRAILRVGWPGVLVSRLRGIRPIYEISALTTCHLT